MLGVVANGAPAGAAAAWKVVPTAPGAQYGHLNDVSCPTASVCFAVGGQDTNGVVGKVIERWNGTKWTVAATPKPAGAGSSTFTAVQCVSTVELRRGGAVQHAGTGEDDDRALGRSQLDHAAESERRRHRR